LQLGFQLHHMQLWSSSFNIKLCFMLFKKKTFFYRLTVTITSVINERDSSWFIFIVKNWIENNKRRLDSVFYWYMCSVGGTNVEELDDDDDEDEPITVEDEVHAGLNKVRDWSIVNKCYKEICILCKLRKSLIEYILW